MAQSGVRGEGARSRVRHAGELGWDDSLYDENGDPVQPVGETGKEARGASGSAASREDDDAPTPEEPVLRSVDMVARPGEVTAVIGSTGSGKST
ncbi:hypothetical protein ABZS63_37535, partial [Streptomyces sp. NPDC005568]